jgi:hypothetical protein
VIACRIIPSQAGAGWHFQWRTQLAGKPCLFTPLEHAQLAAVNHADLFPEGARMKEEHTGTHSQHQPEAMDRKHYIHLLYMAILSFFSMYILMYAMVNVLGNVFNSLNQVYMALLMTAPMVIIELVVMRSMYKDARLNVIIWAGSAVALIIFFLLIRQQTAIGDRQFLRSMIPHHAGAILMCEEAPVEDEEIQALCQTIIQSQQLEIDQMKQILERLE